MTTPPPCDDKIFEEGTCVFRASTGPTGGNVPFEEWVQRVARESGQPVDWHYAGGIARVLALGDLDAVQQAIAATPLPELAHVVKH